MEINHAITIASIMKSCLPFGTGMTGTLYQRRTYKFYSILDMESFSAMSGLERWDHGVWSLTRDGFATPSRIFITNPSGRSVSVYGR